MTTPTRRDSPLALIGNTPLVHLPSVSARAGARIYGKCEFLNPTGSVKDRAARTIVQQAEKRGELRPGGSNLRTFSTSRHLQVIFIWTKRVRAPWSSSAEVSA